jgi:hypothetical protein
MIQIIVALPIVIVDHVAIIRAENAFQFIASTLQVTPELVQNAYMETEGKGREFDLDMGVSASYVFNALSIQDSNQKKNAMSFHAHVVEYIQKKGDFEAMKRFLFYCRKV